MNETLWILDMFSKFHITLENFLGDWNKQFHGYNINFF